MFLTDMVSEKGLPRGSRALAALVFLFSFFALSCDNGPFNPNENSSATLNIRPSFGSAGASGSMVATVNAIRITVTQASDGSVVLQRDTTVNPADDNWNLRLDVPANSELNILLELINRGSVDQVVFSGKLHVHITTGQQPGLPAIDLFPGPAANLDVTSLTITPRDQSVLEGSPLQLQANVQGAAHATVLWGTSNATVATVDGNGLVTAKAPGQAVITALSGPGHDQVTVTVGPKVTHVDVTPSSTTLNSLGSEATFTARALDARNAEVAGQQITWAIADPTIATQTSPGVFKANKIGTTTITASTSQGASLVNGTATLKVDQRATVVTLSMTTLSFSSLGATQALTAEAKDGNGNVVTGVTLSWTSTDNNVATVDANGVVTARGNGTAKIKVDAGGSSAEVLVTVQQAGSTLTVTPASSTLRSINETTQLSAVAKDSRGNVMNVPITWTSSQPYVVSVDANGLATARADGQVVITAMAGTLRAYANVDVRRTVASVIIRPDSVNVNAGSTFQLEVTGFDANGFVIDGVQADVWASSDQGIARVSNTGLITGVAAGGATLSVRMGAASATSRVRVIAAAGQGRLAGRVYDYNNSEVFGSQVVFTSGQTQITVTPASDGTYLSPLLDAGPWDITASAQGYVSTTYLAAMVVPNQTTTIEPLVLVPSSPYPGGISGVVRNARNGYGIGGATVELRVGQNNTSGAVTATTTADSYGNFTFNNLAAQTYTVSASAGSYADNYRTGIVVGNSTRYNQDVILTPQNSSGEVYIVLTWGSYPSDLDSHLTGPMSGGGRFHVYYGSMGSLTGSPWANLDIDDTSSYGPETTTIVQTLPGIYRFSVHDYSNRYSSSSNAMSNSGAKVRVFRGSTQLAEFNVPSGGGTMWTVFEYDGTTVTPIQTMTYQYSTSYAPRPLSRIMWTDERELLMNDINAHPKTQDSKGRLPN